MSQLHARAKDIKFESGNVAFPISAEFCDAIAPNSERQLSALRTYATWLVRLTRRKMAASGLEDTPQNAPKKEVELT